MKVTWNIEEEWLEWYSLQPEERWKETETLWKFYLSTGGSLDREPDSQSPFDPFYSQNKGPLNGRPSMHSLRGF